VVSLTVCEAFVLLLPFDVANRGPPVGDIPMQIFWMILMFTMALLAIIIIPFCMFFYEARELEKNRAEQIKSGVIALIVIVFVFAAIYALLWIFIGKVDIEANKLTIYTVPSNMAQLNITSYDTDFRANITASEFPAYKATEINIEFRVSAILFIVTLFSFVGFLFLIVFGGIGMTALPFDLVLDFVHRPRRISPLAFDLGKRDLNKRVTDLIAVGDQLQHRRNKRDRKYRAAFASFKQSVLLLDRDYRQLVDSFEYKPTRVLKNYVKLILGVLCAVMSLLWFIQIILYFPVKEHIANPLGTIIQKLDNAWGLLGVLSYGISSFYILICVFKGILKVGLRILFIPLYPIAMGDTTMSSFLFNCGVLIISSFTVVHFCTLALSTYVTGTTVSVIFDLSLSNIKGLKYFFRYIPYGLVAVPILTLIALFIIPRKPKPALKEDRDLALLRVNK